MNTEGLVRKALFSLVAEVLEGEHVKWPNVKFDPPEAATWFGVHFLPADRSVATLGDGGFDRATGILQIDVDIPLDSGEEALEEKITALENQFVPGRIAVYQNQKAVIAACRRVPGREAFGRWRASLSIDYYADIQRQLPTP